MVRPGHEEQSCAGRQSGWFGPDELAAMFRSIAGREVRWTIHDGLAQRTYQGRVPRIVQWRDPGDPLLVLRPGATDSVHVLAEMEVRLQRRGERYFLARRRWYEDEDLDLTPLGAGPIRMRVEPAAG